MTAKKATLSDLLVVAMCLISAPPVTVGEIGPEPIPNVATLPVKYPQTWLYVQEAYIHNGQLGQVIILDLNDDSVHYKGAIQMSLVGDFVEAKGRNEMYVTETHYSRGSHGTRTDTLTVYERRNLNRLAEVILPVGKRALMMPGKGKFRLTKNERFALVYNFNPAASVTVVDLEKRTSVRELPLPGCTWVYPMGEQSFSSLCGNGAMVTIRLDDAGGVAAEHQSDVFNDIEGSPLFMANAEYGNVLYFVSYGGEVQPVAYDDASGAAVIMERWPLVAHAADKAARWGPAGVQLVTADAHGRLYVIMRPMIEPGHESKGGIEVWAYDLKRLTRILRIPAARGAVSIEATKGTPTLLAVANREMAVEVYDARTGAFRRTIGGWRNIAPIVMQGVE